MSTCILQQNDIFEELSLDFETNSLIVHYNTKSVHGNASGKPVGTTTEAHKKRIRMKPFTPEMDLGALADAIIKSCPIIPSARRTALVALLDELRHHDLGPAAPPASNTRSMRASEPAQRLAAVDTSTSRLRASTDAAASKEAEEEDDDSGDEKTVNIAKVEDYLEKLYEEDMTKRIEGARQLLALAKQPLYLPKLIDDETLMGALTRVLREDWKKSTDLLTILIQIFFCMSQYNQMHPILANSRIGDLSMKIVELEHRRHTARMLDLERLVKLAEFQSRNDTSGETRFRAADAEARAKEEEAAEAAAQAASAKAVAATEKADRGSTADRRGRKVAQGGFDDEAKDDEDAELGGTGKSTGMDLEAAKRIKLKPLPAGTVDIDKEKRKVRVLTRKQEALIFVCLSLLMNLAVDVAVEKKMCKRNITGLLVPLLERDNVSLLLLVTAFLRKLSVFEENKDAMAALDISTRLLAILPEPTAVSGITDSGTILLHQSTLRLAFNLTFDKEMREEFVRGGLVQKMAGMLRAAPFRATALKVLYHLSQDYPARESFARTDVVPIVIKIVLAMPQPTLPPELGGLLLNLTSHPATAALACRGEAPKQLIQRVVKTGDIMVMKAIRNLSQYTYALQADECLKAAAAEEELWRRQQMEQAEGKEDSKEEERTVETRCPPVPDEPIEYDYPLEGLWSQCIRECLHLALRSKAATPLLVEVLGWLANMTPRDFPESMGFSTILEDKEFRELIERCLSGADDDVILEAVQLISAAALDADAAPSLADSKVLSAFTNLLSEKASDTDIMLQIATAVLRMLHQQETADAIIDMPKLSLKLVELLSHTQQELVAEVEDCIDIIIEHDRSRDSAGLWQQLQSRRFQLYNREWLSEMAGTGGSKQRSRSGAMAMPSAGPPSPSSPGFMHFGHHQQNVAVDLAALYDTASRVGESAARRREELNRGEEDEDEDEISADVRAMMDQYMQRPHQHQHRKQGYSAPADGSARAVSGWEVDHEEDYSGYGYR